MSEEEDKQLGKRQKTANSSTGGRKYKRTALKLIKQKRNRKCSRIWRRKC